MENGVLIKSVSKSISVLQAINRHGSLSITNIARHGKLPYPTAFRIVQTLMHEGLIEQEPMRKHYRPTALVHSLAHGYAMETGIVDVAHPHMSDLTRRIGWPVFIAARVGRHMVVRDATHSETSLTFEPCRPGFTVALVASGTGHAMLSTIPEDELASLLDWVARDGKDAVAFEPLPLRALITTVRRDGHAAKPCSSSTRTSSIAVPIGTPGERADAVLTMTYFSASMRSEVAIERFADALKHTASAIRASQGPITSAA